MTALGAVAQEESRSISENIRWGMQKRFPRGEVRNHKIYGYRYSGDLYITESGYRYRGIEIEENEAAVVKRIFQMVLKGNQFIEIARTLNAEGIPAPESAYLKKRRQHACRGQLYSNLEEGWTGRHISRIIRQERYAGDVLIQKYYTPDYLTHKVRKNKGELEQYLVKNHHPAIIDREVFQQAQMIVNRNCESETVLKNDSYLFSGRLICAECGRYYHVRNTGMCSVWYCPSSALNNGIRICHSRKMEEEKLIQILREAAAKRFYGEVERINLDGIAGKLIQSMERLEEGEYEDSHTEPYRDERKEYRRELESDRALRKKALIWLKTLAKDPKGRKAFLDGITGEYFRVFVFSVTVYSLQRRYMIHWIDGVMTEIVKGAEEYQSSDKTDCIETTKERYTGK